MAKYCGNIGFVETVEKEAGVWVEEVTEKQYFGDIIRNTRLLQNSGDINDNVNISNQFSIVADPYANTHIFALRYIEYQGVKWKVSNVDVQYPRLLLTVGGQYNG